MRAAERWASAWPPLLAVTVVGAVGAPAAVASYRHARAVVASTGDVVMAPWLPLSVDGMLVAALVVIWVRRRRGDPAGVGPWAAFLFGMAVTIAANLAAVTVPSVKAFAVALFPPLALGITLELVALVAHRGDRGAISDGPETAVETSAGNPKGAGTTHTVPAVVGQSPTTDLGPAEGYELSQTLSGDRAEKGAQDVSTPARDDLLGSQDLAGADRAAALIAEGAGRRRLARELDISEHQARELLAERRNGHQAVTR